jgi:hypothetical protein
MKCPACGSESTGNFCPSCGAALRAGTCADCGATLIEGARFCTRCGAGAGQPGARRTASTRNPDLPWYLAGGVLLLLIAILLVPWLTEDTTTARTSADGAGALTPGTPPPLTGTPREQADRLFNRIMTARDRGDMAEALRFTPMAVSAYGMAQPLDNDGLYHLATVHIVAGDAAAALATANDILARKPEHLLGLAVAAEAATLAGDDAAARDYHARFLRAWDAEMATDIQEYQDHARILPQYRTAAERAAG